MSKIIDVTETLTVTTYCPLDDRDTKDIYARQLADAYIYGTGQTGWTFLDSERTDDETIKVRYSRPSV